MQIKIANGIRQPVLRIAFVKGAPYWAAYELILFMNSYYNTQGIGLSFATIRKQRLLSTMVSYDRPAFIDL